MSELKNSKILYGGPLPPFIGDTSRSLGEIVLKLFDQREIQDDVMFVSVKYSKSTMNQFIKIRNIFENCDLNSRLMLLNTSN